MPDRQLQPDGLAGRQIVSPSLISAMDRRAAASAGRPAGVIVPFSGADSEGRGPSREMRTMWQPGREQSWVGHAPIRVLTPIRATCQPSCRPFHQIWR